MNRKMIGEAIYIRPDLRKAASTKAESTTAESAIRPKQLVRDGFRI